MSNDTAVRSKSKNVHFIYFGDSLSSRVKSGVLKKDGTNVVLKHIDEDMRDFEIHMSKDSRVGERIIELGEPKKYELSLDFNLGMWTLSGH